MGAALACLSYVLVVVTIRLEPRSGPPFVGDHDRPWRVTRHWLTRTALPGTAYATSWDAVGGVTTAAKKDTRAMGNDWLHAAAKGKEAGGGTALGAEAVRRRHGMKAELLLALPPTLVVLATVFGIELLRHQRVLYASLASSCAGWLGHPLAQRRHDHPTEAA